MAALGAPRAPARRRLSAHDRRLLFWESFLGNFLFSICMLYGVQATSAVAAGVVMAAIPAAVAILSRLFLGERIAPRVQAAIACAAAGILLLALVKAPGAAGAGTAASRGATACCWAPCCARPATWSSASGSPARCRRAASARSSTCGAWCW